MAKYVVKRAFQFKGGMAATGSVVELSDAEAKEEFFAARTRPLMDGEGADAPTPAPRLGNGEEKPKGMAPAKETKGEAYEMTVAELRAALERLGVPCPPNAKRAELAALWEQAKNATAGTPDEANAPSAKGAMATGQ